jgi:hypothetical protein
MTSEYHTFSMTLRANMAAAKHAALQMDRANCGAFATDRPPEPILETPAKRVLRFRGAA